MDVQLLKNVITKLKTTEIFDVLSRWSFLSTEDVEKLESNRKSRQTKRVVANDLAEFCRNKGGLTLEKAGDLDLIYTQLYSKKKTWSAYHITETEGKSSDMLKKLAPGTLKKELTRLLKLYFTTECTSSVMLYNGLLWGRVYLPTTGQHGYQGNRCLYFVYYPQTPVILMNGMKAAFEVFLSRCLVPALGYKDITEMRLSGHDVESIAELALNKFSNGGFTKFQLTHRPNGPLGEVRSRKRKEPDIDEHEKITCEYAPEKRRRSEILDDTFGKAVLPTLEKVEYRVELPYRGKGIAPELLNQPDVFNSRVRFHGKNVLEGIRNLGVAGFATVPLPKHLTCVPSRARNYFLLAKKQTPSQLLDTERQPAQSAVPGVREQDRTTKSSTPDRVQNRTARSPSLRERDKTVTGSVSHREQNRTARRSTLLGEQNNTSSGSTSQKEQNRTARGSMSLREQNRTDIGSSLKEQIRTRRQSIENSKNAFEIRNEQNTTRNTRQSVKKILAVSQSLNVTKQRDELSESGGKGRNKQTESGAKNRKTRELNPNVYIQKQSVINAKSLQKPKKKKTKQ